MNYEYVIDSYAWIEYFRGTEKGKEAKKFIESSKVATSAITLAELSEKYIRESQDFKEDVNFILSQAKVISLDTEIAIKAGAINFENKKVIKNWGMADSIVLATTRSLGAKVVTGDEHFRNIKDAIMI